MCVPFLTNPQQVHPQYDCNEIGLWSRWQNSLVADILVVGQDWGGTDYYKKGKGREDDSNPTNKNLMTLFDSIGISLCGPQHTEKKPRSYPQLFFTNAVLCLKSGGMNGTIPVKNSSACGEHFLRPLIDLIEPKVVITLGVTAYSSVANAYGVRVTKFEDAVNCSDGYPLLPLEKTRLFPVFHCGKYGWQINRRESNQNPGDKQKQDWQKIKTFLANLT